MIGFMSNIIAQANASYSRISEVSRSNGTEEKGSLISPLYGI